MKSLRVSWVKASDGTTCAATGRWHRSESYDYAKTMGSDRWSAVYWIDRDGNTESVYVDCFSWVE